MNDTATHGERNNRSYAQCIHQYWHGRDHRSEQRAFLRQQFYPRRTRAGPGVPRNPDVRTHDKHENDVARSLLLLPLMVPDSLRKTHQVLFILFYFLKLPVQQINPRQAVTPLLKPA